MTNTAFHFFFFCKSVRTIRIMCTVSRTQSQIIRLSAFHKNAYYCNFQFRYLTSHSSASAGRSTTVFRFSFFPVENLPGQRSFAHRTHLLIPPHRSGLAHVIGFQTNGCSLVAGSRTSRKQ